MDNLRKAHMGNYSLMLSLLGFLEGGLHVKKLADRVIDSCESGVECVGLTFPTDTCG